MLIIAYYEDKEREANEYVYKLERKYLDKKLKHYKDENF